MSKDVKIVQTGYKDDREQDIIEFNVKVQMKRRWVPHFLSMLKTMQSYGAGGVSRAVALYVDGDGDFHPRFEFNEDVLLPNGEVEPDMEFDGNVKYDAG